MEYLYTKINRSVGYSWNMLQRILNEIGVEPIASGDMGEDTFLRFDSELTEEQKTKLDAIMADNPTVAPNPKGSRFIIKDIWNDKDSIANSMGIPYEVYYSESVPGSGNINQIEIHFSDVLDQVQIDKVIAEYAKLISIK